MKILKDNFTYVFNLENKINIFIKNSTRNSIIQNLFEYFGKKKKTYCKVFDSYNNKIATDEFDFIYFPYDSGIQKEMEFKEKSNFNSHLCSFIENNPDYFNSIEEIREGLHHLLSDKGVYKLLSILKQGLTTPILIDIENFDIQKIIQMFHINCENLSEEEQFLVLYNLELYIHKDKNCIVYIDYPITEKTIQWIQLNNLPNIVFILGSNISIAGISSIHDCAIHKLSNTEFIEKYEYQIEELADVYYSFHPIVQQFIEFQNEKIQTLYYQFIDENVTFSLFFTNEKNENCFI